MVTRSSMCTRFRLVIAALGLYTLNPCRALVAAVAPSAARTSARMVPVVITIASLPYATGKISAPAGIAVSFPPFPAGATNLPAAIGLSSLPAAGGPTVPAAVTASPFPAAGTVSSPSSMLSAITVLPSDLVMSRDQCWNEPGQAITLTSVCDNRRDRPAPPSSIRGALLAGLIIDTAKTA